MTRLLPLLLLLVLAGACSGADTGSAETEAVAESADSAEPAGEPAGGLGSGGADATGEDAPPVAPALPAAARSGDRLIKDGTMTVEIPAGGFDRAFDRVVAAARELGGAVVATTSSASRGGATSGSVTVRVPVERYEDLLVGVGRAGEVRHRDITTRDVTAEFTDLESRLRHARAQEAFYLGLLEEAEDVADAIAIQQQLEGIQATIEQLQGRRTVLEDRTTFSTLTVELVEPGAGPLLGDGERPVLARYVAMARDAFVTVVGTVLVGTVAALPLLLPVGLGLLAWRALGRRGRRATVAAES